MNDGTRLIAEVIVVMLAFAVIIASSMYVVIMERRRWFGPNAYLSELSERISYLERERGRDHATMMRLQVRITELEIGVQILTAQLRREGLIPEWTPPAVASNDGQTAAPLPDSRALTQVVAALFNRDEIDDLASRLGIDTEEIGGETRGKRARALVDYAERHGMLDELVAIAKRLRPEGEF